MIGEILGYFSLTKSLQALERGDLPLARVHADRAISRLQGKLDFIEAFEARVLMLEGRHDEAISILKNISSRLNSQCKDQNILYIFRYCEIWLNLYSSDENAFEIKKSIKLLSPKNSLLKFLPFPSDEKIQKILNI